MKFIIRNILVLITCFACLNIITSSFKARERTIFSALNSDINEMLYNETKYPPQSSEACLPEKKNQTYVANFTVNYQVTNITTPLIIIPTPTPQCNVDWNYSGHGSDWECYCTSDQQSPIDLPTKDKATLAPIRPVLNYEIVSKGDQLETVDNINGSNDAGTEKTSTKIRYQNYAIKIIAPNMGKLVKLDGSWFVAEEIQFHTPSEHTIAGERFDMEMQIIHYGRSQGDIAKQAVLSFLFKKSPGKYNKFIDSMDFYSLPNPLNPEREIVQDLYIPNVLYSSDDDDIPVMKPFSFYTYEGSLTSPPCTERTTHYVAADPIELSSTALAMFKEALRKPDRIDEKGNVVVDNSVLENYREKQALNEREVFIYDHTKYDCPKYVKKIPKLSQAGHYEKRVKEATQYIRVNGNEPSGLPGAFVVGEDEAKGIETQQANESAVEESK